MVLLFWIHPMCLLVTKVNLTTCITMCLLATKIFTNERPLKCLSLTVPLFATKHPHAFQQLQSVPYILDLICFLIGNQAQLKQPWSFYSVWNIDLVHFTYQRLKEEGFICAVQGVRNKEVWTTAEVAVLLFIAGAFLSVYIVKVFSHMLQFTSHIYVHTVSKNAWVGEGT